MHKFILTAATLATAIAISACGAGKSPTTPSTTAADGNTAIVSGSVRAGSPLLAASTGSAVPGLVVTVVGTTISSGVDAADRFTLTGVPPGDIDLRFSSPGIDSTVRLSQVLPAQTVSLIVNLAGTTVVVDSEIRSAGAAEQLEGRVESLPPTMADGSLVVAGRTVKTDTTTRFEQGGAVKDFAALQIGMRVHVEGAVAGSDLHASLIRIQNTKTWIPVEINGVIDSLSGNATLFQFKIGSRLVKGDALTTFFGSGNTVQSFATLKDGVRVEVKGQQRDGYVYAERLHVNDADVTDDNDGQDESASIHDVLTAIGGTKPALTLTVGGTTVRTSSATEVQRRGDVQTLDTLKLGQTLHVIGVRQADGSLDARRIQIDDDQTGGEFEIEGSLGSLKGTCPALTFSVNGFSITTNNATDFDGAACSALKNGDKITVNGLKQADGSVLATRVKR
jgi:hypothetical protein